MPCVRYGTAGRSAYASLQWQQRLDSYIHLCRWILNMTRAHFEVVSVRRHATLALACPTEMVYRHAFTARPSTRPSLTSCGCLRGGKRSRGNFLQFLGRKHGAGLGTAMWLPLLPLRWGLTPCISDGHRAAVHKTCCKQRCLLCRQCWQWASCAGSQAQQASP